MDRAIPWLGFTAKKTGARWLPIMTNLKTKTMMKIITLSYMSAPVPRNLNEPVTRLPMVAVI